MASQQPLVQAIELAGGTIIGRFAFGNTVVARVPARALVTLIERDDVQYVMPRELNGEFPDNTGAHNQESGDDALVARAEVNADEYYDLYGSGLVVGLVDTGVRASHNILAGRLRWVRDCRCGVSPQPCEEVGDQCDCVDGQVQGCPYLPGDSAGTMGHGTKTAAIISGTGAMGSNYRGVTKSMIDSWAWRRLPGEQTEPIDAMLKAVRAAVYHGDTVIVAELEEPEAFTSPLAKAFDDAFDFGSIVVAANGNHGHCIWNTEKTSCIEGPNPPNCDHWPQSGSVDCPANAHKVLGVGYYNVMDPDEEFLCENVVDCDAHTPPTTADRKRQSLGPAGDGRIKPDILMPTRTETGCAMSDSCISLFCHSSGATPYAAGVATLLYNFMNGNGLSPNAGKVYAGLIAFGTYGFPSFDNWDGAGPVALGTIPQTKWFVGTRYVSQGQQQSFTFPVTTSNCMLRAAIWWPETLLPTRTGWTDGTHSDIDLVIKNQAGELQGVSWSVPSVFEKVNLDTLTSSGYWTFNIQGYSVPAGSQKVYYFLYSKTGGCP